MKYTTLLVTGAAVAAAQKVADYFPECSVDCLADSVSAASDCTLDDAWCICIQATYEAITAHGTSCVMKECGADVAVGKSIPKSCLRAVLLCQKDRVVSLGHRERS